MGNDSAAWWSVIAVGISLTALVIAGLSVTCWWQVMRNILRDDTVAAQARRIAELEQEAQVLRQYLQAVGE